MICAVSSAVFCPAKYAAASSAIKISMPLLLASLIVGLLISIFQTVTSIQEQTLTFVPKIICVFLTLMLLGHWMMNQLIEYMTDLWLNVNNYLNL